MTEHRSGRTYHDDSAWPHLELGPRDDRRYVEQLIKAIFQAGLSWAAIESHWPAFSEVFHGFDPVQEIADLRHHFPGLGDYSAWWFMQSVGMPTPPTQVGVQSFRKYVP
jgi:Methyladenine glycosylase